MYKNMISPILKYLNLTRPLIFFDTECTGLEIENHRIVEIGCLKIYPDGKHESKRMLINPGMPIPPAATEIHGITDEMVKDSPLFIQIAKALFAFMDDCDYSGYNLDQYDIPMLCEEFSRCKIEFPTHKFFSIDVLKYERIVNGHKLGETYKRRFKKELEGAHGALTDTMGTFEILVDQLDGHEPMTVAEMDKLCQGDKQRVDNAGNLYMRPDGVVCFNFGKHKDDDITTVPSHYITYIYGAGFPKNTKDELRAALKKK